MSKKIAVLAVAIVLLAGLHILSGATRAPRPTSSSSSNQSSQSSVQRRRSGPSLTTKSSTLRRRRVHRRRRRPSPWHVSSFGDPGALDNPAGEDTVIRQAALEALAHWNGSVVVVDPNSGRILSIVNQKLALGSSFTPCSTFKPVVALAALKEGIVTPDTELRVSRRTRMNLAQALARSNNPFFSKLGQMLGFRRLADYAHEFGLGEKAGREIPGEVPGHFPSEPPKEGGVGMVASYGQDIEVTPVQMAAVISAIANGGTLYELQYPRTQEEVAQFEPRVRRRLAQLAPYIPKVKEGLAAAVLYGTGRWAFDPQIDVYGKTGTCSENGVRLGWFVSYAEQQQPKYVVVVLLRGGRPMFGPHAAQIAGRLYHDLRQREENATQANRIPSPTDR